MTFSKHITRSLQWRHTSCCFMGIIVERSGPEMSRLVSCILLSAWFAWCLGLFQGWDVGTLGNTFSRCVTQDSRLGPSEACAIHSSLQIPRLYHIQGIDRIKMADEMLNRKLLEKQRVQNRSASYEVHIGHFFYNVNATVSFGNHLTLPIYKIFHRTNWQTDKLTNRQTDKTNCLTPLCMCTWGN